MTKEKAAQLIPLLQAYTEGKTIQVLAYNKVWNDLGSPNFNDEIESYRVKPENEYRAWTFEEAPFNVIFSPKDKERKLKFAFYLVNEDGYIDPFSRRFSFTTMLKDYLYSSDNGKTWLPCGTLI
jgi:hypothetical protein